ncbi:MAG: hypothetical protein JNG88_04680, partial [Phycisphaerales bacterium]|nr:hypothetical protein [Phycisphaerales bacterium]
MHRLRALHKPGALVLGTLMALIGGCAQSQYSRQNEKFRLDSLEWSARTLAQHEADRPQNLEVAAHHVDRRLYYNARQLKFNLEAADHLADWRKMAASEVKGQDIGELAWTSPDGLRIKPLYTAADLE